MRVTYQIDGGGYQNLLWFSYQNNGDAFNEPIGLDTDFDGNQDGVLLQTALQNFTANIVGTGSTLDIRIAVYMDGANEEVAFDNIVIEGISGGTPNPTIGFDSSTSTEIETNTTFASSNIPVTVSNYDGNQIDIDVSVTGGNAEPSDYTFTSPTSLSFTADGTQNITIDINDDADFDDETIELTITETSSVSGLVISQATHTVTILDDDTPPLPNIVINEILADPTGIDANGDGTVETQQDEFVELVNNEIFAVDITGYTLSDGVSVRYTFGSVIIPAGGSVVVFGGVAPAFSIFSHLVEDNMGAPFATQAIGETDYNDTTITLGVNANQGEQLTFSIAENTLPASIDVYLDDTLTNTSTLLNTSDYVLTPKEALNGTGRFYLRFTNSALSLSDNVLDGISIYINQTPKTITIAGTINADTVAKIYDLQGRLVHTSALDANTTLHTIDANSLQTGIYIVNLVSGTHTKTKKVILR